MVRSQQIIIAWTGAHGFWRDLQERNGWMQNQAVGGAGRVGVAGYNSPRIILPVVTCLPVAFGCSCVLIVLVYWLYYSHGTHCELL